MIYKEKTCKNCESLMRFSLKACCDQHKEGQNLAQRVRENGPLHVTVQREVYPLLRYKITSFQCVETLSLDTKKGI